jgi:hypothetical protein
VALLRDVARHLAALLAVSLSATLVAFAWLLVRSDGGALDVTSGDAIFAAAVVAAALPAWTVMQWHDVAAARRGTRARTRWRRALWFALHPVSIPAWSWLATLLAIVTMTLAAYVALAISVVVLLLGIASLCTLLAAPHAHALHTRLALLGERA